MALKLKYKDEHGILQINMSPSSSPRNPTPDCSGIADPKFDTINNRFGQYDLFGGKYEGGEPQSLFRSRYNSIEEELANTPYAFATERSLRLNNLDIRIKSNDISPSRDIEDDRFFRNVDCGNTDCDLFGPQIDLREDDAFTVTQLIHAQDRYFDLSSRQSNDSCDVSARAQSRAGDEAFKVLPPEVKAANRVKAVSATVPAVPTAKRKREKSFAILAETPVASRPTSPRSLPVDIRHERISPFRGRGFREETSRHNTPKTSTTNSRTNSPPRRRTNSLSRIDNMAQTAALPPPMQLLSPHSPRNFLKENIKEVRGLSELNREKHEAEAERKRIEEEEALLKEMGLLDKKSIRSRSASRNNSPNRLNLRSRSNSPSAILHFENIPSNSKEFRTQDNEIPKTVTHRSRVRSVSRSQPQSNDGSPKHSKIPKRQNSVSPTRTPRRDISYSRRPVENNLNKNQRFISNSTSSIHETIKIGSQVHDKRAMSKSTQNLDISPAHIKNKPPISPGRGGPPPSNKVINAKRLSPIVGTPSKSPTEDLKPGSAKTPAKPSPVPKKTIKTAGNTPASSRLNSRQQSRTVSRDPSPEKRTTKAPSAPKTNQTKPVSRVPSNRTTQKPSVPSKPETKNPMSRTSSMKSLTRTPSTKTLNEKPPLVKKVSRKDLTEKAKSTSKINDIGAKREIKKPQKNATKGKESDKENEADIKTSKDSNKTEEVKTQDNETQYDKITNEKGELVIMTKKSVVSMTTAAITSQPLEVVTTVTNQLPAALEKAREKGMFERLSSKDSLVGKDEEKEKEHIKKEAKEPLKPDSKESHGENEKNEDKKHTKNTKNNPDKVLFTEDHVKLKPLQPPYNNPQVERVRQKIDDIMKEPEISRENILTPSAKSREAKSPFRNVAEDIKRDIKETKDEVSSKLTEIKDQAVKQNEKIVSEIRSEATKIVDSIITPVEEPKDIPEKVQEVKKEIEPIVMVVNEKKNNINTEIVEKVNETLVKGEADVEVQSSNVSTIAVDKMAEKKKMADGSESDKSGQSNGGYPGHSTLLRFPQSTSTTPKPPARTRRDAKDKSPSSEDETKEPTEQTNAKRPNICERIMGKCKSKCCPCCIKGENDTEDIESGTKERESGLKEEENGMKGNKSETTKSRKRSKDDDSEMKEDETGVKSNKKVGLMEKLNCCKRKKGTDEKIRDLEKEAGKVSVEFESETKRKRKFRDVMCGCCGRRRRVSDASEAIRNADAMSPADVPLSPAVVADSGCCGRKKSQQRRDSILSDRPPTSWCNNRLGTWLRGMCRRTPPPPSSRRPSMFSKNKSLSPTLPPEDTREKLDTSLVEHTSVMRGAIPVLPIALAYFCLVCNILVPGLGTIFSGLFCLCFGIPRFGVHDGAKQRIGSFVINLLVGAGQLFTVLFCLVGWGWSVWWGVIMIKISRKYRKLRAESAAAEAEAPPVTANNHTRA